MHQCVCLYPLLFVSVWFVVVTNIAEIYWTYFFAFMCRCCFTKDSVRMFWTRTLPQWSWLTTVVTLGSASWFLGLNPMNTVELVESGSISLMHARLLKGVGSGLVHQFLETMLLSMFKFITIRVRMLYLELVWWMMLQGFSLCF